MDEEYLKYTKRFSVSYMNNSKWCKLLKGLAKANATASVAEWSFIDSDHTIKLPLPEERDLLDKRFADGRFQPFEYKWILNIKIPKQYRKKDKVGYYVSQDLDLIKKVAAELGEMPIFDTEEGIEIRGYQK